MLDGPLLLPPLLLAILLVVSGVAKVRAPAEVASAFAQLRLPTALSGPFVRRVFPWAEIVLAVLLVVLPGPWSMVAAVAASLLMLVYLAVIVRALGFGYPITCSCFGRLGLGEVTRRTALRNTLLVGLALLGVWSATADRSVVARFVDASGATWLWLALVALTAAVVVVTFGGTGGGHPSPAAVPTPADSAPSDDDLEDYVRQPTPFGLLKGPEGEDHPLHQLARHSAHLLVFVSPGCGACSQVIPQIKAWDESLPPVTVRAVVSTSVAQAVAAAPALEGVTLEDPGAVVAQTFATGNPGAVLLGMDGMLAGGPVVGSGAVEQLVADIRAELEEAGALTTDPAGPPAAPSIPQTPPPAPEPVAGWAGRPVPDRVLQEQDGTDLPLPQLAQGAAHLLVFVSPGCGACTKIIPKIAGWDAALDGVTVRAVVAMPIDMAVGHSPDLDGVVLHDPDAGVSSALGLGTPGAVLVGPDGTVAAGPVSGGVAVEQLVEGLLVSEASRTEVSAPAGE